jgi:hypothetical protein
MHYCPTGNNIDCPQHSGFDICFSHPQEHLKLR